MGPSYNCEVDYVSTKLTLGGDGGVLFQDLLNCRWMN